MSPGPLPFDPIVRAAELWEERIGPSGTMAAVTSIMRVQQVLQSAVDGALRPHGLTFARYEALVLLTFAKRGSRARQAAAAPDRPAHDARGDHRGRPPAPRGGHHRGHRDRLRPARADRAAD